MVRINGRVSIPLQELEFTAARGGGPGGQHVNKVASKVVLRFDVRNSRSLDEGSRRRLLQRLAPRLTTEGVLIMSSHETRSQAANREQVIARFASTLREALKRPKPRRATRPSRAAKERRIESKKRRGGIKKTRGPIRREE